MVDTLLPSTGTKFGTFRGNLQNTSVGAINSAIIGGSGNTINVSNTAIIAGTGITASDSNTVYMNNLEVTHITNTDTLRVRNNAIGLTGMY